MTNRLCVVCTCKSYVNWSDGFLSLCAAFRPDIGIPYPSKPTPVFLLNVSAVPLPFPCELAAPPLPASFPPVTPVQRLKALISVDKFNEFVLKRKKQSRSSFPSQIH